MTNLVERGGPKVNGCIIEEEEFIDPTVKSAAAHTYDNYRSRWDQFDPDAVPPATVKGTHPVKNGSSAADVSPKPQAPAFTEMPAPGPLPPQTSSRPSLARVSRPVQPKQPKSTTASSTLPLPRPTTAEGWKDRGNELFKGGSYEAARDAYSASIKLAPTCLGYANRAMAVLKLGDAAAAEMDCTAALKLDRSYIKAYQRRAAARQLLNRIPEAVEDIEAALQLQPTSKLLAAERGQAVAALLTCEGLTPLSRRTRVPVTDASTLRESPTTSSALGTTSAPCPVPVGATLPAKSPLRLDQESPVAAAAAAAAAAAVAVVPGTVSPTPEESARAVHLLSTAPPQETTTSADALPSSAVAKPAVQADDCSRMQEVGEPLKVVSIQSAVPSMSAIPVIERSPAMGLTSVPVLSPSAQLPSQVTDKLKGKSVDSVRLIVEELGTANGSSPPVIAVHPVAARRPVQARILVASLPSTASLVAPKTGSEFERVWRSVKGDATLQQHYLCLLQPAGLPALLKSSLTPAVLADVVRSSLSSIMSTTAAEAARQDSAGEPSLTCDWVQLLEGFKSVPRFTMAALGLPGKQKAELTALWDGAVSASEGGVDAGRLTDLRKCYRL